MIKFIPIPQRITQSDFGLKNDVQLQKSARIFSISFFITGIFAAIGALYRWGDGSLFNAPADVNIQLYIAELVVATPASIFAALGILKLRRWGILAALFATGVFIYGSVLVYASVLFTGFPLPLKLIIPPIFGICLSIATIKWIWGNFDYFH